MRPFTLCFVFHRFCPSQVDGGQDGDQDGDQELIEEDPSHDESIAPTILNIRPTHAPSTLSMKLSIMPSDLPSLIPSDAPSTVPSDAPSLIPSDSPSLVPSVYVIATPVGKPSDFLDRSGPAYQIFPPTSRQDAMPTGIGGLLGATVSGGNSDGGSSDGSGLPLTPFVAALIGVCCMTIIAVGLVASSRVSRKRRQWRNRAAKQYCHHDFCSSSFSGSIVDVEGSIENMETTRWLRQIESFSSLSSAQKEGTFSPFRQVVATSSQYTPTEFVEKFMTSIETQLSLHPRSPTRTQKSVSFCLPDDDDYEGTTQANEAPAVLEDKANIVLPPRDAFVSGYERQKKQTNSGDTSTRRAKVTNAIHRILACTSPNALEQCASSCTSKGSVHLSDGTEMVVHGIPSTESSVNLNPFHGLEDEELYTELHQWKGQGEI